MNARHVSLTAAGALLLALLATAAAVAAGPRGHDVLYQFRGHLKASSATSVSVSVEGGNRFALRKMLGASVDQTFAAGPSTEFLKWSKGVPTSSARATSPPETGSSSTSVHPAARRSRRSRPRLPGSSPTAVSKPTAPGQPLFLFRGAFVSAGPATLTIRVARANPRALRLLLGEQREQTFAYGPDTIFLLWKGKVPTVVSAAQLKAGDRITIRVRAKAGSTLRRSSRRRRATSATTSRPARKASGRGDERVRPRGRPHPFYVPLTRADVGAHGSSSEFGP